jgi:hypothetical protein
MCKIRKYKIHFLTDISIAKEKNGVYNGKRHIGLTSQRNKSCKNERNLRKVHEIILGK